MRGKPIVHNLMIGTSIGLVILVGCAQLDKAVSDVNTIAETTQTVLDSPAGRLAPPDWRLYGGLATTLLMGSAAAYKQWRLSQMSKTTKAIVRGIEATETLAAIDGSQAAKNPGEVKAAIAVEMRKLRIYDAGNKLVDRFKTS